MGLILLNLWGLICGLLYVLSWGIFHVHLKEYPFCCCLWNVYTILSVSIRSNWFTVLFKIPISLLVFSLVFLSIIRSRILKPPTIIVEWSISLFSFVSFASCILDLLLGAYTDTYLLNHYVFLIDWHFDQLKKKSFFVCSFLP